MSKELCVEYDVARYTFEEANEVLGYDLRKICFEGSLSNLCNMENMFPALLTSSVAAFNVYMKEVGVTPQFCAGHSLGEYAALTCAGVIKFEDALRITHKRGIYVNEVGNSGIGEMTVINGIDERLLEDECKRVRTPDSIIGISCYNSPLQSAVSGTKEAVEKIEDFAVSQNGTVSHFIGGVPIHSALMKPAMEKLKNDLGSYSFHNATYPVISNVTARPYNGPESVAENLYMQLISPVKWRQTLDYMNKFGISLVIEMSPKNIFGSVISSFYNNMGYCCFGQKRERDKFLDRTANSDGATLGLSNFITKCLAAAVATPNLKGADVSRIQANYNNIQEIRETVRVKRSDPTVEQINRALSSLKAIFEIKGVNKVEQEEIVDSIINETGTRYYIKKSNFIPESQDLKIVS